MFTLANGGNADLDISFQVSTPAGVSVIIPPASMTAPGGSVSLLAVTVALDALLPAGNYPVMLRATTPTGLNAVAGATLNVVPAPGLKVVAPSVLTPGPFTVNVTNTGNGADSVTVTARAPAGASVAPAGYPTFRLLAGESRDLTFTAAIPSPGAISIVAEGASGARSGAAIRALPDAGLPPPPFSLHGKLRASYPTPFNVNLTVDGPISDFTTLRVYLGAIDGVPFGSLGVTVGAFTVEAGLLSTTAPVTGAAIVGLGGRVTWAPLPWLVDLAATASSVVGTTGYQTSDFRVAASLGYSDRGFSARASGGLNGNPNFNANIAWAQPAFLSWSFSSQYALDPTGVTNAFNLPKGSLNAATLDGDVSGSLDGFSAHLSAFAIWASSSLKLENRFSTYSGFVVDSVSAMAQLGAYYGGLSADFGASGVNLALNGGAGFPIGATASLSTSGSITLTGPDPLSSASVSAGLSGLLIDRLSGSLFATLGSKQYGLTAALAYGGPVTLSATGGVTWRSGLPAYQLGGGLSYTDGASTFTANASAVWAGASTQIAGKVTGALGFDLPVPDALTQLAGGRNMGVVTGVVYLDENANGMRDANEPGLKGAIVESGEYSAKVHDDGSFTIYLPAGTLDLTVLAPALDVIPPDARRLNLAKDATLVMAIGVFPGATVSLRVAVDPNPDPPSPEGASVVLTGPGGSYSLTSGPDGSGQLTGLPSGDYTVAVSALPPATTGEVDVTAFSVKPGGAKSIRLNIHPPAVSNDLLAPSVDVGADGYLPPGAEPLVTATEDGGADSMALVYPDGSEQAMARQANGSFAGRYVIPTDAQDAVIIRVRARRGANSAEATSPVPIAPSSLATAEFTPGVPQAGADVTLLVKTLFVADSMRLSGDRVNLDLTRDALDATLWHGLLHLPADANGRTEFVLSGKSARVSVSTPVILVVRTAK